MVTNFKVIIPKENQPLSHFKIIKCNYQYDLVYEIIDYNHLNVALNFFSRL